MTDVTLLERLRSIRPLPRRGRPRRLLVAIPRLDLLKVVVGVLRGAGEDVVEVTDLIAAEEALLEGRRQAATHRPFEAILVDARDPAWLEAMRLLRAADPQVRFLALISEGDGGRRRALHRIGALTLSLPLSSQRLLSAVAAVTISRALSVRDAGSSGYGLPYAPDPMEAVTSGVGGK